MSENKVELSNETLRRALEAANKEYPDKKDAFGKNQAFYLGVCHEAERSQKLDKEIERLKAEVARLEALRGIKHETKKKTESSEKHKIPSKPNNQA